MKTKEYIVTLIAACSLSSCNDLIDIYPVENNFADTFYTSEFEINQAAMGIYARLGRNGIWIFQQFIISWLLRDVPITYIMRL